MSGRFEKMPRRFEKMPRRLGWFALFSLGLAVPVLAQGPVGTVTGTVVDSEDGPVSGVLVFVDEGTGWATTGEGGAFQLEGISAGTHLLNFRKGGFAPRTFDLEFAGNEVGRDVGAVVLEEGRDPTATLTGRITDGISGEPVANAVVKLNGDMVALTDRDGDFLLSDVPIAWGSNELEVGRFAFLAQIGEFWIVDPDETVDLSAELDPAPVELGGVVATLLGGGGGPAAEVAERGGPDFIPRAELEGYRGESAYDIVELIRRRWVRPQRSSGTGFSRESVYARVVIDGSSRRELRDLTSMNVDGIENMRYMSPVEATTKYGTGFSGGVIEVTTRGR